MNLGRIIRQTVINDLSQGDRVAARRASVPRFRLLWAQHTAVQLPSAFLHGLCSFGLIMLWKRKRRFIFSPRTLNTKQKKCNTLISNSMYSTYCCLVAFYLSSWSLQLRLNNVVRPKTTFYILPKDPEYQAKEVQYLDFEVYVLNILLFSCPLPFFIFAASA